MPQVLIRIDAAGEWPVLVRDDEALLPTGDGSRWRYVCDVGTVAEGNAVRSAWLRARLSPEVRLAFEEERRAAEAEMRRPGT